MHTHTYKTQSLSPHTVLYLSFTHFLVVCIHLRTPSASNPCQQCHVIFEKSSACPHKVAIPPPATLKCARNGRGGKKPANNEALPSYTI